MKLLFIEWEDSCQGRGWEPTENFCHTRSMRCFSVGWKVAESKDSITLAPHVSGFLSGQSFGKRQLLPLPIRCLSKHRGCQNLYDFAAAWVGQNLARKRSNATRSLFVLSHINLLSLFL